MSEPFTKVPVDEYRVHEGPTQWAYEQACKALQAHRERADKAEAEVERLKAERDEIEADSEEAHRIIDNADGEDPATTALDIVSDRVRRLVEQRSELRTVLMVISTDLAQDCLEDPVGYYEREKSGFYRLGKGAVLALKAALATPGPGET